MPGFAFWASIAMGAARWRWFWPFAALALAFAINWPLICSWRAEAGLPCGTRFFSNQVLIGFIGVTIFYGFGRSLRWVFDAIQSKLNR